MRRVIAITAALAACAAFTAALADPIEAPTRVTPYDWQCQDANGVKLSDHQRFDTAFVACMNNAQGDRVQGGTYRLKRGAPAPTCPAKPADQTQTAQCPPGTTGTWEQKQTYASAPAPTCWTPSGFLPVAPPAGACTVLPSNELTYAVSIGGTYAALQGATVSGSVNVRTSQCPEGGAQFLVDGVAVNAEGGCPYALLGDDEFYSTAQLINGAHTIEARFVDGGAISATFTVNNVPPPNRAPTISGTPTAAVVAGQAYSFQPSAADLDGDTLAFSITNRPTWAAFDPATGRLSGTPTTAHVGVHSSITITVSDGRASASTPAFSITVTVPAPPLAATTLSGTRTDSATVGRSNVNLSWTAVSGATTYQIERCTGPTCTNFTALATVSTLSCANTNLPGGFTYRYRVRGADITRQGPYSNVLEIVAPVAPTAPGTATLSWTPPTTNTDGSTLINLTGYLIEYSEVYPAGPTFDKPAIVLSNPGLSSYVISNLTPGTWAFRVLAVTPDAISNPSNVATKTVP